jgi:hypothetical protein
VHGRHRPLSARELFPRPVYGERVPSAVGARRVRGGLCFVLALLVSSSAHAQPATEMGTPGTTIETAIVLPGIADEFHGVVAEHSFIADHFPTWHIEYSARFKQSEHDYDVLGMIKPDKTKVPIFFDITAWVGK